MPVVLRILTLNCWALPQPWPIGSRDRVFRLQKIADALLENDYDIVALQEVWGENDYNLLQQQLSDLYSFNYYFHSGFTGSGVCVFCRYPIVSTLMHRYSLNGFAHHIHRGDWFGGKVVGMIEIEVEQYRINFYTTHLHAEYNRANDLYLPHRISQAFELSQFVKHTSRAADAIILTGDLNLEPDDLGYQLIIKNANLKDAWLNRSVGNKEDGATCDRQDNCYTSKSVRKSKSPGKRLDYIMYQDGQSSIELLLCENQLNQIPGENAINYSDHIGVYAEFSLSERNDEDEKEFWVPPVSVLKEAIKSTGDGEVRALWDRRLFLAMCFVLIALFVSTLNVEIFCPSFTILASAFRFVLTLLIGFCLWYGLIGLTMELKALKAAKTSMTMLLND